MRKGKRKGNPFRLLFTLFVLTLLIVGATTLFRHLKGAREASLEQGDMENPDTTVDFANIPYVAENYREESSEPALDPSPGRNTNYFDPNFYPEGYDVANSGLREGDNGLPEGNTGLPEGDSGLPEGDNGLPEGDNGLNADSRESGISGISEDSEYEKKRIIDLEDTIINDFNDDSQISGGGNPLADGRYGEGSSLFSGNNGLQSQGSTPMYPPYEPAVNVQYPLKVVCVGDSITQGAGARERISQCYPSQLQGLLGSNYIVSNYGLGGSFLTSRGDLPYRNTEQYRHCLNENGNIYVIMLGTNDTRVYGLSYEEFQNEYYNFVRTFMNLSSKPRIILCIPPKIQTIPGQVPIDFDSWNNILIKTIIPAIRQCSLDFGLETVNLYSLTAFNQEWYHDGLHPNEVGYGQIAMAIKNIIG